jgi:hypothetical protein
MINNVQNTYYANFLVQQPHLQPSPSAQQRHQAANDKLHFSGDKALSYQLIGFALKYLAPVFGTTELN